MILSRKNEEVKIGDEVLFQWDGSPHIPKWLSGTWGKVLGFTKKGLVIVEPQYESGTRRIYGRHIAKTRKSED